ncbi:MAG: VCBS repeat-containing protein, partial [Deltaproteobacteria bacterium]|nr:VCBS repeat-containing protein [Deltaproteobacteria bacterium]
MIDRISGSLLKASSGVAAKDTPASGSTINGLGVSASFDSGDAASLADSLSNISRAFSNSFLRLNTAVTSVRISKDSLEKLLGITDKLIGLAKRASEPYVDNSERVSLNTKFKRHIKEFKKIIADAKEEGVDLLDKKDLAEVLKSAGIDPGQASNLAQAFARIAGMDELLGIEPIRSPEVAVEELIKKKVLKDQQTVSQKTVGDGSFQAGASYATGASPRAVTSVDIDGDGLLDLVTSNQGENTLSILKGLGDGTFGTQVSYATGSSPGALLSGDFDGDGNIDIASASYGDSRLNILLGNADGTLKAASSYALGANPQFLTSGDFNADGITDLLSVDRDADSLSIMLGVGDGTFESARAVSAGVDPSAAAVGDYNGDGRMDVAVANSSTGEVSVLSGKGDGTFEQRVTFSTGAAPEDILRADLNNDGRMDLFTVNSADGTISVLKGNGDGTFQAGTSFAVGEAPITAELVDFDKDGKYDILVGLGTGAAPGAVALLRGNGDGTFDAARSFASGDIARSLTAGDFNADGAIDVASVDTDNSVLRVLLGNTEEVEDRLLVGSGTFSRHSSAGGLDATGDGTFTQETTVSQTSGDGSFKYNWDYSTGLNPKAVGLFDFDDDGFADLVTADAGINGEGGSISVQLGNGDGSFRAAVQYAAGDSPRDVDVVDVNGDGRADLVVPTQVNDPHGDGSFSVGSDYDSTAAPKSIELYDFNQDGNLDVVTTDPGDGSGRVI